MIKFSGKDATKSSSYVIGKEERNANENDQHSVFFKFIELSDLIGRQERKSSNESNEIAMNWEKENDRVMENSSEREKRRPTFNLWNDAQILTHVAANVDRASQIYNRNPADIGGENYYHAADKASFHYLNADNTIPSYTVNTVHLQNPYRPPQRLEGFTSRNHIQVRLVKFRKSLKSFLPEEIEGCEKIQCVCVINRK